MPKLGSTKTNTKYDEIMKKRFKTLRIKKQMTNQQRKSYKKVDGRSAISQYPILASTPPKLKPIREESPDSIIKRTPIKLERSDSPTRFLAISPIDIPSPKQKTKRIDRVIDSIRKTAKNFSELFSPRKTQKYRPSK